MSSNVFGLGQPICDNPDNEEHFLQLLANQELPSWWRSWPSWAKDGYEKDQMAFGCEQVQGRPFLLSGRQPAVGQALYVQLNYDHDGSHPEFYKGWARMVGEVTKVLPPPPAGLYSHYPRQHVELSEEELSFLRKNMPEMPPCFLQTCPCGRIHTLESVLEQDGQVHGQAVVAKLRLSCDDVGDLEPQLAGDWDVIFIANDNKGCFWEVRAMKQSFGL